MNSTAFFLGTIRSSIITIACVAWVSFQVATADEASQNSSQRAVAQILGGDVFSGNVSRVHDAGKGLAEQRNYERLRNWVLPANNHQSWRLTGDFRHGELIAPAIDLVTVAQQLGQLNTLRAQVTASEVTGSFDRRCQLAMLCLVEFAAGNKPAAEEHFAQLFATYDTNWAGYAEQIPETLAMLVAAEQLQNHRMVTDYVGRMVTGFMLQFDRNAWQLKLWEIYSTQRTAEYRPDEQLQSASHLRQWSPVSRVTARTHGDGHPAAKWGYKDGRVDIQASHSRDYLYFRSPLRGNFVVEADVTSFGFRGSHLGYADTEMIPVYNLKEYALCQFRSQEARLPLTPQAWEPREWFRYRLEVADGIVSTIFNGHQYPSQILAPNHDPWLSICSPIRFSGGVRNLRITGDGFVPNQIPLATSERLSGWLAYYEDEPIYHGHPQASAELSETPTSVWSYDSASANGGIVGRRETELPVGCHKEHLLRYHRPMLEDGVIEYDFLYDEGHTEAHPAIGRWAFLIQPDGVNMHQLTDGRYERTSLPPDNFHPLSNGGAEKLDLKQNGWNRLRCILTGDQLQFELNGNAIATHQLSTTEDRTFGLFYYSDSTALHVRNIQWTGNWDRELPTVSDQEMAGHTTEHLDDSAANLAETFFHDFADSGLSTQAVRIEKGTLGQDFVVKSDGLHASYRGVGRYQDVTVGLNFSVEGDFDISTQFAGLVTDCSEGDSSTIALRVAFEDDSQTRCSLRRCRLKEHKTPLKPVVRCYHEYDQPLEGAKSQRRRMTFEQDTCEATSGTLRLARRGDQLHFLLAEGRSEYFRVIGVRSVGNSPVKIGGIDLHTQLNSASEDSVTSVVWKNISVRAEKIVQATSPKANILPVAKLNGDRDQYTALVDFDFSQMQSGVESFVLWGNADSFQHTPDGVRFISLGTEGWSSTGAWPGTRLQGDFDVSSTFQIEMIIPAQPKGESSVYLQAIFHDERETNFSTIWDDGVLSCRIKTTAENGRSQIDYLNKEVVPDVISLRYARRGDVVYALVTAGKPARERVFAAGTLSEAAASSDARITFLVQTRGVGRETHCLWKKVSVHQPIQNIPPPIRLQGPPGGA